MGSWTPQHKAFDLPRLLAQDLPRQPYIPAILTLPEPNNPPSPVEDDPSENHDPKTLFHQGVEEAARRWFEGLPLDLQRQLPNNPLQAFRRVLIYPGVVPPLYRYEMIQNANRTATAWISGVAADIRNTLPRQALEAFQSVVLRLTVIQHTPAPATPATQPTGTNVGQATQQPAIANRVLQEQQQRLPPGIQAGAPHYGLRLHAPQIPPAPQAAVAHNPEDYSMETTESPQESYKRKTNSF